MEIEQNKTVRKKELVRAAKFTLFSISAGMVQAVSFAMMNSLLKWDYRVSYLTALVLSVVWNFTFNRRFTFKAANNVPIAMLKIAAFYAVFTPLSTWGGDWLEGIGWNEYIVLAISMLLNFVLEFLYDRFFVFGKSTDSAEKKPKGKV